MFFNLIKNYLTVLVVIAIRKCAFIFVKMISIRPTRHIKRSTWCCERKWVFGIAKIARRKVRNITTGARPHIIFNFFVKEFKCCNEDNCTNHVCSDIQIIGQLQNQISCKNRNPKRKENRLNDSQEYFFKNRRIFFSSLIFSTFAHRSILAIQYLIISKTPLINQKIWRFQ